MKPRSMHAIVAEILQVCVQKTKRTHVIYKANLSHSMLQGYVELAWQSGLLEELPDRSLLITEKGREYLAHFTSAEKMLKLDASDSASEEREHPASAAAASQVVDAYT
ncbi:MAG: winged helix-turn-helix domain-containing protein [Nitrososphaera sp.]